MSKQHRGRNEGSISQRSNGSWRAQVYQSGKRLSKDFHSKNEALTWVRTIQREFDNGYLLKEGSITIEEYLPSWLENRRLSLRAKTAHQYSGLIGNHILPNIGSTKLRDLRLAGIENYYAHLAQLGVGTRTIRIVNNILHSSLDKAVRYGWIISNPTQGATLPRYQHDEMRVLDPTQVIQFLIAAKNSPNYAMYHLAIATGMRLGELLGLKWCDVHFNVGLIHVQRQKQYVPGEGCSLIEPKTKAGRRTIKVGEGVLHILRDHEQSQIMMRNRVGDRWVDMDLVFPNSVGRPGDASNIRVDFNRVLMAAGLHRIRIHDLRHTAASLLLNHKVPVIVVSNILGHSKPSVTLDIYAHVLCDMQGEAASIMDKLVPCIPFSIS